MRRVFLFLLLALLAAPAWSQQITKTVAWDASSSAATAPVDNPVKYRLYTCADQTFTGCQVQEAGTALEIPHTFQSGTVFQFATAYWYALVVDGVPQGDIAESGKSNVMRVTVQIPPGNPGNAKIRVVDVEPTNSGQTIGVK
jgi:hypothetical protein